MATQIHDETDAQTYEEEGYRRLSAPWVTGLMDGGNGNCIEGNASDVIPSSKTQTIGRIADERKRRKSKARKYFERVVIGLVIAAVWGLLILPIVFYDLPQEQVQQPDNGTNSSFSRCNVSDLNCTITCHEDFYLDGAVGYCKPHCGRWRSYSTSIQPVWDACIIISAVCGITAGIVVIALACFHNKKVYMGKVPSCAVEYSVYFGYHFGLHSLFKFPNAFIIFQTITGSVYTLFILIAYADRTLFCSSYDLVRSVDNPTPFCTILGIVSYYAVLQLTLWVDFHVVVVFWAVVFPFHKQKLDAEGRTKYIYSTMVLLGLILPCVPVVVVFGTGGFNAIDVHFPCLGRDRRATVYSILAAISVLIATGISLLIIVFRKVIKVYGLNFKRSKGAEFRVFFVFCYIAIMGVSALTALIVSSRSLQGYINARDAYFLCERNGIGTDLECDRSEFEEFASPALLIIGTILIEIYPAVNLVYVIHIADLKNLKKRCASCCN